LTPLLWALAYVVCQRLGELAWARRNTRRLLAEGGVEWGAGHYPLFVLLHLGWLAAMALLIAPEAPANWPLVALFAGLQGLRAWVLASLGRYWTTRVITVPGAPLVRGGPYRFMRHPNYAIVVAELALLPLAFGAWEIALVFSALNLLLLRHRLAVEAAALAERRLEAGRGVR
jgi:methyltransferase